MLILNANPFADALHRDAIYRVAVDNDGDLLNDIAFSYVFSEPKDGKQTVDVYLAANEDAESAEAVGEKIFSAVRVSFVGDEPHIATSDDLTAVTLPGESPWTGVDSNTEANVFSTASEIPTNFLGADPDIRIWGRCSLRRDGELLHDEGTLPDMLTFTRPNRRNTRTAASSPTTSSTTGWHSSPRATARPQD